MCSSQYLLADSGPEMQGTCAQNMHSMLQQGHALATIFSEIGRH
jgi:hypothetical protein